MPPLVGKSEDKCSKTSRKSHLRPTKLVLEGDGTSKNRGLRGQLALSRAVENKINNIRFLNEVDLNPLLTLNGPIKSQCKFESLISAMRMAKA